MTQQRSSSDAAEALSQPLLRVRVRATNGHPGAIPAGRAAVECLSRTVMTTFCTRHMFSGLSDTLQDQLTLMSMHDIIERGIVERRYRAGAEKQE